LASIGGGFLNKSLMTLLLIQEPATVAVGKMPSFPISKFGSYNQSLEAENLGHSTGTTFTDTTI
jgi:hypothetical protein